MSINIASSPLNREVAMMTPAKYLRRWKVCYQEHPTILIILGIAVVTTILLSPLVWATPLGVLPIVSDIINAFIYLIGARGIIVALSASARTRIERALAAEVIGNAAEPKYKRIELSKLPEFILPANNTLPPLGIPRMVYSIRQEAQSLRFGSAVEIVQPYMDEALESVFEIVNLQKLALRGGICATFVGLLLSLKQLGGADGAVAAQGNVLGQLTHELSGSLFIAFSGSTVGLQMALVLGGLLLSLRASQSALFREMMNATSLTLDIARQATNDGQEQVANELNMVLKMIQQLNARLHEHGIRIETSMKETQLRINAQTETIALGLKQLEETKIGYDRLINDLTLAQNNFTAEIRDIYRDLSLDRFRMEIRSGIVEAGTAIAKTLDTTEKSISHQTEEIDGGIQQLNRVGEEMAAFLVRLDKFHNEFLTHARKAQAHEPITQSNDKLQIAIANLEQSMKSLVITNRTLTASLQRSAWARWWGNKE